MRSVLAIVALLLLNSSASAFTIRGTIENGTTGSKDVKATVVAVNPSEGMEDVAEAEAKGGRFELTNLDPAVGMYLVRAYYAGVEYSSPVTVTGQDQEINITVYDATSSWEGVNIVVPHLAASRHGDELQVEMLYEITNDTTPQRAIVADGGAFRLYLPADMDSLTNSYVSAMGVPIERTPTPTDIPNVYQIDYPIRPGVTRIGLSYTVPYGSGTYTLAQKFLQGVTHLTVFAVDPSMKIASSTHTFEKQESVHGMSAYTLHGIAANTDMVLAFAGGNPDFAGIEVDPETGEAHEHAGDENVIVVPGDEETMSIFLMITVLLVLAGVVGMALRDHHDPLSDPKVLRSHYATLVSRLARLDDLRAAEAIPNDAYRATREDLMGRLSALAMQLRAHGGLHHPPHGEQEPTHKTKVR